MKYNIHWQYNFGGVYTIEADSEEQAEEMFNQVPTSILVPNIETGYLDIDQITEDEEDVRD